MATLQASSRAPHPLCCAEDVQVFLESFFEPAVPWHLLGGIAHICAMTELGDDGILRNICIGKHSPKSMHDFFMLNLGRALAAATIQSASNMRHEGGVCEQLLEPFTTALIDWRRSLCPQLYQLGQPTVGLLTSGHAVDPTWDFFKLSASKPDALVFKPIVITSEEGSQRVRQAFESVGPPVPEMAISPRDLPDSSAACAAKYLTEKLAGSAPAGLNFPGGQPVVLIECGPTTTRPFYTQRPSLPEQREAASQSGAGALPVVSPFGGGSDDTAALLQWVTHGCPVAAEDCPVDWWMLSTFRGAIKPQAVGNPLARRAVVDSIFDVLSTATALTEDGTWTFELLRNRARPLPEGWGDKG